MDWSKLNDWLRVAGFVGVIGSLVFVGLEMQQSREIAIADIYQSRANMVIEAQGLVLTSDKLLAARTKLFWTDESLTPEEEYALWFSYNTWLSYWENNHFQYQSGLLSEEQWLASRNAMRKYARTELFRQWWEVERDSWRESFASEVNTVINEELAKD